MRALAMIALLLSGLAGASAVRAADGPPEPVARDVFIQRVPFGYRAGPIIVYDFQPGVVVRAYWRAPWRSRHYFPFGAAPPEPAADDDGPPKPAESFERFWSTAPPIVRELPALRARGQALPSDDRRPPATIQK